MLATSKIAPALAFGNTCVIKPSEYTPLALARFMELLIEAGVPAGVVNMVNGRGHITGAALVDHPLVRMVSFTGGGEAGKAIASAAGRGLKKCAARHCRSVPGTLRGALAPGARGRPAGRCH